MHAIMSETLAQGLVPDWEKKRLEISFQQPGTVPISPNWLREDSHRRIFPRGREWMRVAE